MYGSRHAPNGVGITMRVHWYTLLLMLLAISAVVAKSDVKTKAVTVEGVALRIIAADLKGPPRSTWTLEQDDGSRMKLRWAGASGQPPAGIKSAMRVRVEGFTRTTSMEMKEPAGKGTMSKGKTAAVATTKATSAAATGNVTAAKGDTKGKVATDSVLVVNDVVKISTASSLSAQSSLATAKQIKVAVFVHDMSACPGGETSTNLADATAMVGQIMFENVGGGDTAEGQFRACTYNKLSFDPAGQEVFVVKVPANKCSGSKDYGFWSTSYTSKDCASGHDMQFFLDEMERIVISQGTDLKPYQYRWHIISKSQLAGPSCWWGGMASLGCGSSGPDRNNLCRIMANSRPDIVGHSYLWMHEGGHNLGLDHAGRGKGSSSWIEDIYGDESCALGGWGEAPYGRCFNMAHAFKLGLLSPQGVRVSEITGSWRGYSIWAGNVSPRQGLRIGTPIKTADDANRNTAMFVSYRAQKPYPEPAVGGDTDLDDKYVGLLVHLWPNPRPGGGDRTSWEATLTSSGERFLDEITGLVVEFIREGIHWGDKPYAIFKMCQRSRVQGNWAVNDVCGSGKDDNCDGEVGGGCGINAQQNGKCGNGVCEGGEKVDGANDRYSCHQDCCQEQKQSCRNDKNCCIGLRCDKPSGQKDGTCVLLMPPDI